MIETLADGNSAYVGDLIQTRRNTSDLVTSNGRRVLNRDVWRVTETTADGRIVAVHIRAGHSVTIDANYAATDVVLAYATTIAGAQGRTTDRSHVLVTPHTTAQSLYVGMTRGRESNTAHVVCDAHDHEELRLGERSPRDAFIAAMQRDPDGSLSAHTIAERWHDQSPARDAARRTDRKLQEVARLWNISRRSLRPAIQHAIAGDEEAIVRALARLGSNSERVAAIRAAKRVLARPGATVDHFVATLTSPRRHRTESPGVPNIGNSAARSPNRTR